jgi:hypothetical protein
VFGIILEIVEGVALKQGWAKLALYIKLAPTLQLLLFEILTRGFLHLVGTDQT